MFNLDTGAARRGGRARRDGGSLCPSSSPRPPAGRRPRPCGAARGLPPGFSAVVLAGGLPPAPFAALRAASARSGFALARCRPRPRSPVRRASAAPPPPCRACGRGCARPPRPSGSLRASLRPCPLWSRSPRLWLPCGRLRLWSRSRRVFGSPRRGLPAARAGALVWLVRGALPRRGLSRRFAALGGLRSSPPPGYGVYVPASIGPWLATVAPLRWDA